MRTDELRQAILRSAVGVLERGGPPALTARDVATAAGTSTAALYELFGGKAGLVRAVFYRGFRLLLDRLASVPTSDDPRADLVAVLAASRAFASDHPVLFDVMYTRPFAEFEPDADDRRTAGAVYRLVVDRVERWLAAAGSDRDPVDAAHALVATGRGLSAAELAGLLGTSRASRERRWHLTIDALLDGLV